MNDCWLGIRNHYISTHPLFGLTRHMFERKSFRCIRKFRNIKRYFMLLWRVTVIIHITYLHTQACTKEKGTVYQSTDYKQRPSFYVDVFQPNPDILWRGYDTLFIWSTMCWSHGLWALPLSLLFSSAKVRGNQFGWYKLNTTTTTTTTHWQQHSGQQHVRILTNQIKKVYNSNYQNNTPTNRMPIKRTLQKELDVFLFNRTRNSKNTPKQQQHLTTNNKTTTTTKEN